LGGLSGLILCFDVKTLDSAGQTLGKNRRPIERGYGKQLEKKYLKEGYCFSVCGAAALYRREAIEKIKIEDEFFDEEFFAFYEDLDAGWRLNLLGYRCKYIPKALVYHHRGGSRIGDSFVAKHFQIGGRPPKIQADIIRNRWLTILKNDIYTGNKDSFLYGNF
jgi:GT2 family glycosyltransferase